jgi:hypothetical protein
MAIYRLLFRDAAGHLKRSEIVDCLRDRQAIDIAAQRRGEHASVEVWYEHIRVCLVGVVPQTPLAPGRAGDG